MAKINNAFILIVTIFFHIVDDYYLQGWLASAKQKEWWEQKASDELYKYDYIWALIMHGFSWGFTTMLPIAIALSFDVNLCFIGMLIWNMLIHAIIDNLKANKKVINLWQDQLLHMGQIIITFCLFVAGKYSI